MLLCHSVTVSGTGGGVITDVIMCEAILSLCEELGVGSLHHYDVIICGPVSGTGGGSLYHYDVIMCVAILSMCVMMREVW